MQCLTHIARRLNQSGGAAGVSFAEVDMNNAKNEIAEPDRGPDGLAETHVPESLGGYQPRFSLPSGARPLEGYTIKRGVGAGGFGEVYYATSDAGKDVALKRIQRNLDIELRGVRQCLNLKHPNLLSLFDIRYDDDGQAWVVMEYVSGENLQSVIERNPNGMPLDQVHFWLDGIIAGVGHLHDCGIVHRDLKPGNIFLDSSTVKIGDYGLSKFISCSRRSGQTQSVGTFHYMAPEIGQGRYGKEIDIYALGIMLYEMLTGHVPYDGESSQEIIMKHLTAQPPVDHLPSPYHEVIGRSLAKDPAERFSNVTDLRDALNGAAGTHASPVGKVSAAWPAIPLVPMAGAAGGAKHDGTCGQGTWTESIATWFERRNAKRFSFGIPWQALVILAVVAVWLESKVLILFAIVAAVFGVYSHYTRERKSEAPAQPAESKEPCFAGVRVEIGVAPAKPKRESRRARRARARQAKAASDQLVRYALSQKSSGQRWTELLGALLMVSLVTCVISVAACLLVLQATGARQFELIPNFLWIMLSSTLAAWGVLAISKPWEGSLNSHGLRRFPMLILGFLVGGASFGLSRFLAFQPANLVPIGGLNTPHLHGTDGAPLVGAYLMYFGILFVLTRWWLQADPMRRNRVCMNSTLGVTLLAFVLEALFQVPQAFLIAGTTSLAIQFAAPWVTPDERKKLEDPSSLAGGEDRVSPFPAT